MRKDVFAFAAIVAAASMAALLAAGGSVLGADSPPAAPAAASAPDINSNALARATGYLSPGMLDITALLGPPPAPDSPEGRADQARWAATRALQGSPRWALAVRDDDLDAGVFRRFSCAAGVTISQAATPATWRMLSRMDDDVRIVGTPAKNRYNRPRPIIGNTAPICVPRAEWMVTNASYPSGHSAVGWSWGLVLAELLPARADDLLANGRDYGESRVICGVHYQSDVAAGRIVASAMVARLHSVPEFQSDLILARAELNAPGLAAPTGCEDYSAGRGPVSAP